MAQVTVQIADKATLDTVNTNTASTKTTVESTATDVTTLKGRGGIKYNSTTSKPQVYDTTNSTWVDLEVGGGGGGASPTLVVVNDSGTMTGKDITVVSQDGLFTQTKAMPSDNYIIFELPWLGTYYISWEAPSGATVQQTAVVSNVGGITSTAAIPKITVVNGDRTMDGKTFTVKSQDETEVYTKTMVAGASMDVSVNGLGTYTVTWVSDVLGNTTTNTVVVSTTTGTSTTISFSTSYPAFATASDANIAAMLTLHYNNEINLSEIWAVGDTRDIDISAMSATGVGESHSAQTRQIAIIDFNHDDLQTSINGHTKAAVTIQLVDSLDTAGYMNSSNTNVGGWTNSARRTWCNDVFYNALPSAWKTMVKTVQKKTSAGNQSSTINTDNDKTFFLSEIEVFNSNTYAKSGEGTQYPYYTIAANRIKKRSGSAGSWWLRSPSGSNSTHFVGCGSSGSVGSYGAGGAKGLAPALCI